MVQASKGGAIDSSPTPGGLMARDGRKDKGEGQAKPRNATGLAVTTPILELSARGTLGEASGAGAARRTAPSRAQVGEFCSHTRARVTSGIGDAFRVRRVRCGARRRRDGRPCQALSVPGKRRCRWHGGCSTGARTPEGRARSLRNLRQFSAPLTPADGQTSTAHWTAWEQSPNK